MDMALDLAGQGGALSTAAPDLGLRTNHLWTSTWASVLMACCDSLCSAALAFWGNEDSWWGEDPRPMLGRGSLERI